MSNLGPYQEIVTTAKTVGGVPALIRIIEDKAVAKAAPGIFAKGLGAGAILMTTAGLLAVAGQRYLDQRRSDQEAAAHAKADLTERLASGPPGQPVDHPSSEPQENEQRPDTPPGDSI